VGIEEGIGVDPVLPQNQADISAQMSQRRRDAVDRLAEQLLGRCTRAEAAACVKR
jgi:hypothetical protein